MNIFEKLHEEELHPVRLLRHPQEFLTRIHVDQTVNLHVKRTQNLPTVCKWEPNNLTGYTDTTDKLLKNHQLVVAYYIYTNKKSQTFTNRHW